MALGRLGLVHLLRRLYGPVLIPSAVYEEVVIQGLKSEHPDASIVELAVTRQELTVVHMDDADLSETVRALSLGLQPAGGWLMQPRCDRVQR